MNESIDLTSDVDDESYYSNFNTFDNEQQPQSSPLKAPSFNDTLHDLNAERNARRKKVYFFIFNIKGLKHY